MCFISCATFSLLRRFFPLFPPTPCLHSQRALQGRDLPFFCNFRLLTFPSKAAQCKISGRSPCLTSAFGIWEKALLIALLSFSRCTGVSCFSPCCPAIETCLWQEGPEGWGLGIGTGTTGLLPPPPAHAAIAPSIPRTGRGWYLPPRYLWVQEGGFSPAWSISQGCSGSAASCSPWEGGGRPGPCLLPAPPSLPGYTSRG